MINNNIFILFYFVNNDAQSTINMEIYEPLKTKSKYNVRQQEKPF